MDCMYMQLYLPYIIKYRVATLYNGATVCVPNQQIASSSIASYTCMYITCLHNCGLTALIECLRLTSRWFLYIVGYLIESVNQVSVRRE